VKKYVLDTNVYIRAFRSRTGAEELKEFLLAFSPNTYLSSVVLHELLVGANTQAKAREIEDSIAEPLKRVGRVITPSHAAWETAGKAIAAMARKEKRDIRSVPKSLVNDYVLAASSREAGTIVITENTSDFASIRKHIAVAFEGPWPS
jgi:predicted nucleic acid-binding protein